MRSLDGLKVDFPSPSTTKLSGTLARIDAGLGLSVRLVFAEGAIYFLKPGHCALCNADLAIRAESGVIILCRRIDVAEADVGVGAGEPGAAIERVQLLDRCCRVFNCELGFA